MYSRPLATRNAEEPTIIPANNEITIGNPYASSGVTDVNPTPTWFSVAPSTGEKTRSQQTRIPLFEYAWYSARRKIKRIPPIITSTGRRSYPSSDSPGTLQKIYDKINNKIETLIHLFVTLESLPYRYWSWILSLTFMITLQEDTIDDRQQLRFRYT